MHRFWRWYKGTLTDYPLRTKAVTASTLMSISDILCQTLEHYHRHHQLSLSSHEQPDEATKSMAAAATANAPQSTLLSQSYDWQRTFHVGVTGMTFSGPISHAWYNLLERFVGEVDHQMIWKLILDAILFSPTAVAGYFIWRSILEGHKWEGTIRKLQSKWSSAVCASWTFWPAANVINFGMIPLQYRVLYNNMLSLFWNAYLSNVNSRNIKNDGKGSNVIDVDGEELRSKVNDVSSVVSPSTRQQQQKQQRSEMKSSLMRLTCYLIILSLITEYLSLGKHSSE